MARCRPPDGTKLLTGAPQVRHGRGGAALGAVRRTTPRGWGLGWWGLGWVRVGLGYVQGHIGTSWVLVWMVSLKSCFDPVSTGFSLTACTPKGARLPGGHAPQPERFDRRPGPRRIRVPRVRPRIQQHLADSNCLLLSVCVLSWCCPLSTLWALTTLRPSPSGG